MRYCEFVKSDLLTQQGNFRLPPRDKSLKNPPPSMNPAAQLLPNESPCLLVDSPPQR